MEACKWQGSTENKFKKIITLQDKRLVIQIGNNCIYSMFSSTVCQCLWRLFSHFLNLIGKIQESIFYRISNGTKLLCRCTHLLTKICVTHLLRSCFWLRHIIFCKKKKNMRTKIHKICFLKVVMFAATLFSQFN